MRSLTCLTQAHNSRLAGSELVDVEADDTEDLEELNREKPTTKADLKPDPEEETLRGDSTDTTDHNATVSG